LLCHFNTPAFQKIFSLFSSICEYLVLYKSFVFPRFSLFFGTSSSKTLNKDIYLQA